VGDVAGSDASCDLPTSPIVILFKPVEIAFERMMAKKMPDLITSIAKNCPPPAPRHDDRGTDGEQKLVIAQQLFHCLSP